MAAKIG